MEGGGWEGWNCVPFRPFFPVLFCYYFFACLRDSVMPVPETFKFITVSQILKKSSCIRNCNCIVLTDFSKVNHCLLHKLTNKLHRQTALTFVKISREIKAMTLRLVEKKPKAVLKTGVFPRVQR